MKHLTKHSIEKLFFHTIDNEQIILRITKISSDLTPRSILHRILPDICDQKSDVAILRLLATIQHLEEKCNILERKYDSTHTQLIKLRNNHF